MFCITVFTSTKRLIAVAELWAPSAGS